MSTVERYMVEAWINPREWDSQDAAQGAINEIMSCGTDDEAEWVRIMDKYVNADRLTR